MRNVLLLKKSIYLTYRYIRYFEYVYILDVPLTDSVVKIESA